MADFLTTLQQKEVKKFIEKNIQSDPKKLILNPPKEFSKSTINFIVEQIQARQKARGKLNNWVNNFDLLLPPLLSIEQASSESTAMYKKQIAQGERLIDLTGGMGIDCLALSNQFTNTIYVEKEESISSVFNHNIKVLKKNIEVKNELAEEVLKSLPNEIAHTTIYIDPARRDDSKNKVFKLEDCTPNLKELMPLMKLKSSQILIKLSPIIDIKSILKEFDSIKEVHIVSIKNDCKELLIYIDFSFDCEATIKAVNLKSEQPNYVYTLTQEEQSTSQFGNCDSFIFEPNASILKAGAFKKIGEDFNLKKIAKNTHLYTSDFEVKNFPGRTFKKITEADKKTIREYSSSGRINVLTRNYPIKPDALKKKWKLKDGGDYFLIGFKDVHEKAHLIIAERV